MKKEKLTKKMARWFISYGFVTIFLILILLGSIFITRPIWNPGVKIYIDLAIITIGIVFSIGMGIWINLSKIYLNFLRKEHIIR